MTDPTTPPPEETGEGSGSPIGVIPPRRAGSNDEISVPPVGVILIPPLGLDRVAKLTEGFRAWWSKHGPQTREAIIDAIAIIAEAWKPTPPPAPPTP